jgi:Head fiber protein.
MNDHVSKNYNTDGGNRTVIGGVLEFEDGAEVRNMPAGSGSAAGVAANQESSTATAVAGLKNDFNALLVKLKNAGIMTPDAWNISARLAPALTDSVAAANNSKASVALADGVITVTADVDALEASESSAPGQGTHKWIGLGIGTGLTSVALAKYNGSQLTEADASEAASVGLDQAGEFVLYIRADEVVSTPKTITLQADGYGELVLTITVIAPAAD